MKLTNFLNHPDLIPSKVQEVKRRSEKKGNKIGNSADDVLINETERMTYYISDVDKNKIVDFQTALRFGVNKIGSANDSAMILKNNLMPETSKYARRISAIYLMNKYASANKKVVFYSKNRYYKKISYMRKGKLISYYGGFDVRTNKRVKINKRLKYKLVKK